MPDRRDPPGPDAKNPFGTGWPNEDMDFSEFARLTGQDGAFNQPHRSFHQHAETTSADLRSRLDELAQQVIAAMPRVRVSPKLAPNIRLVALNLYAAYRVGRSWPQPSLADTGNLAPTPPHSECGA